MYSSISTLSFRSDGLDNSIYYAFRRGDFVASVQTASYQTAEQHEAMENINLLATKLLSIDVRSKFVSTCMDRSCCVSLQRKSFLILQLLVGIHSGSRVRHLRLQYLLLRPGHDENRINL